MNYEYDVTVIGAGSAGMVAAEVAARMGVRVTLIERGRVGGDCLWTGCVPSKALLASARTAQTIRTADVFGLPRYDVDFDDAPVWQRIRRIQREIAQTDDSPDRFRDLGVDVIFAEAAFEGDHLVRVGDRLIQTKYALVCTGSRPTAPPIAGLSEIPYLTSEGIFELERAPRSLLIIGAGAVGVEMAQAMNRLGVTTILFERLPRVLPQDEADLAVILLDHLKSEGVEVHLNVELTLAEREGERRILSGRMNGHKCKWSADELFVATGRKANIESLQLARVGVDTGAKGIVVNEKLRTSARWIYAAGDCAGRFLFTHSAGAEAATALRNMFFPGSAPAPAPIPWTTFTDPELAHVGLTSEEARTELGDDKMRVFTWDLRHSDRARTEGATVGKIMVVTDDKFRIVGAHILSPSAGEMISQFMLAIKNRLRLTPDFGNLVQVYPTYSTSVSQAAAEATYGQLQKPFLRTLRRINDFFAR